MLQPNQFFFQSKEVAYDLVGDEGIIISIRDGIVKACGLRSVTAGEMVVMGEKGIRGMALNLEHDRVGIVILGTGRDLKEGDYIMRSFTIMEIASSTKGTSLFYHILYGSSRGVNTSGDSNFTEFIGS